MAVKIRLVRMGSKKSPFYRIVAADSRTSRNGRFIEILGTYNPLLDPAKIDVKEDLVIKWIKNGATPTDTVRNILSTTGLLTKLHEEKSKK